MYNSMVKLHVLDLPIHIFVHQTPALMERLDKSQHPHIELSIIPEGSRFVTIIHGELFVVIYHGIKKLLLLSAGNWATWVSTNVDH